jgi:proteasome lid subunit RPN8/RPN11
MFNIPIIEECPHTSTGQGIVHISHDLIATFAGATSDTNEWMAFLIGTRSSNGLDINVTDVRIPLQSRTSIACKQKTDEPLAPDVVGVIHLHPGNMTAFFSTTDVNTLNPRFPMSIVIAGLKHTSSTVEQLLGFNYKAEGRAQLPCGSLGIIPFSIIPAPIVSDWPTTKAMGFTEPNLKTSLRLCQQKVLSRQGLMQISITQCGLTTTEKATSIFGCNGDKFLNDVKAKTQDVPNIDNQQIDNRRYFFNKNKHKKHNFQSEGDWLSHWNSGNFYGGE